MFVINQIQSMLETKNIKSQMIWLNSKKTNLLEQFTKFEEKSIKMSTQLIDQYTILSKDHERMQSELEEERRNSSKAQISLNAQIDVLKGHLDEKDVQIESLEKENNEKQQKIEQLLTMLRNQRDLGENKIKNISKLQEELRILTNTYEQKIQAMNIENEKNIENMISKYENLIENKVSAIASEYQLQLQKLKQENMHYIEQLQKDTKQKINKNTENLQKNSTDYERIIEENKKLLSNLNQYKRKFMNLETQAETDRQQLKLGIKEKQMMNMNLKREISCLKEDKANLESKIKNIKEELEEKKWENKQILIYQDQEVKKIKGKTEDTLQRSMKQHKREIDELTELLNQLKQRNIETIAKNDSLRIENQSLKEMITFFKKQREAQTTKQQQKLQSKESLFNEENEVTRYRNLCGQLKKQMMKKNAEIQILKQEITRIKGKLNRVTVSYQEHIKAQELMEKENKMLLSQIIFLRDKGKSRINTNINKAQKQTNKSQFLDLKSEQSQIYENEDLEAYKELIVQMEKDMNEAAAKIDEKNKIIEKQKQIIERLERALNSM